MRTRTPAILALSLLTIALAACDRDKYDSESAATPADTTAADPAAAAPADTGMGTDTAATSTPASYTIDRFAIAGEGDGAYLTDSRGRRLYTLDGDEPGVKCVGDCLKTWRPVTGPAPTPDIPEISAASIGTVTLGDGTTQVTYYGRPLYYYDDGTGVLDDVNVIADESPWGRWYSVNAAGETIALKEGVPTTVSPTAAGADARDLPTQSPGGKPREQD
jgi:predicted lipoprotein with Yx(FWY)xxD motif